MSDNMNHEESPSEAMTIEEDAAATGADVLDAQGRVQAKQAKVGRKRYKGPYLAYTFLSDPADDWRCDYELLTDALASEVGHLYALVQRERQQGTTEATLAARAADTGSSTASTQAVDSATPASATEADTLPADLLHICELIYHANPSLRTKVTVTEDEVLWLAARHDALKRYEVHEFLLPQGCELAASSHLLRAHSKDIARFLYKYEEHTGFASTILYDWFQLLSNYFYLLALRFNAEAGVSEVTFTSRNYILRFKD